MAEVIRGSLTFAADDPRERIELEQGSREDGGLRPELYESDERQAMKVLLSAMVAVLATLALTATASAAKPGVAICHKGKTITVAHAAVKAHVGHGDKVGHCSTTTPPVTPPVDPPVVTIPDAPAGVARVLVCTDEIRVLVLRTADGSLGYAADIPVTSLGDEPFASARLARFYVGYGATCEKLGGTEITPAVRDNANGLAEYPVWTR